jgi:hypothetical protein
MVTEASQKTLARKARRLAQRVSVNGRLVHPDAPHGKATAYSNYGCRCELCATAWCAAIKAKRLERRAARVVDPDGFLVTTANVRHGVPATYTNWGCQCRPCLAAHSEETARNASSRAVAS